MDPMRMRRWLAGAIVALAGAGAGSIACNLSDDAASATETSPLIKWSGTPLWDGGVVTPICFVNGSPQQWQWLRNAVEESWGNVANLHFVGWKACNFNDHTPVVSVGIGGNTVCGNTKPPNGAVGLRDPNAWNEAGNTFDPQIWICFGDPDGGNIGRPTFEAIGVHEFGHELGFEHEQSQDGAFTDPAFDAGKCSPAYLTDDAGNALRDDAGNIEYDYGTFPDQHLTPYDPDSVMNYCHQAREYSPRISDLDIQGMQTAYGVSTRVNGNGDRDSDGDGWADYRDNCPYTKNDQTDSNFDAELTLAKQDPSWSSDNGHRPLAGDTQAYKDHWHDKYKGDACDPTVSTSATIYGGYTSALHTGCCTIRYVGGVTSSTTDCNQQCPYTFDTGLTWTSFVGGPAGFSITQTANSAPAFCKCDKMFTSDQGQCTDGLFTYQCMYARDDLFPPLSYVPPPGNWHTITREADYSNFTYDTIHGNVQMDHANIEPWVAPTQQSTNWDLLADLPTFGKQLPPTHDDLLGLLWAHVNSAYPYSIINRPLPTNLQNSYSAVDGAWQYGEIIHWVTPFGRKWWRIPYCNPFDAVQHTKYGQIAYGVSGNNSGDAYAIAQDDIGVYEFTRALTPTAISLMNFVSADTAEILVADDRVSGWPSDGINPNAIVVNTNTTKVIGAFTTSGSKMDAVLTSIPTQTTATLRSYVATTGKLYSLENVRGWRVYTRDVPTILAGQANATSVTVTGALPSNPRAVTWNPVTNRIMVLDWLNTAERMLSIDPIAGASTEIWRTATFSGPLPSIALSSTRVGEVVLSQWGMGDNVTHVVIMQSSGRPTSSTTVAGSAQSAVVANSSGITAPITQTVGDTTPNVHAAYVNRSALSIGVCGSPWFKAIANNQVGTGPLADGPTCP